MSQDSRTQTVEPLSYFDDRQPAIVRTLVRLILVALAISGGVDCVRLLTNQSLLGLLFTQGIGPPLSNRVAGMFLEIGAGISGIGLLIACAFCLSGTRARTAVLVFIGINAPCLILAVFLNMVRYAQTNHSAMLVMYIINLVFWAVGRLTIPALSVVAFTRREVRNLMDREW